MTLADLLSPGTIVPTAALAGAAFLAVRALKARMVRVVRVIDRNGKVHEMREDDPRISGHL
ncbi:hypothetical protein ACWT_2976 [Actinoplanes sp. SE50]|uniref:hypothetical protein n=1 Tax=unclassified Actinoplanes TaxID=2626549 RepID=UPI00023EBD21|nr:MULTISPECIES: hypothetical protein [unclassified Actinoplanes]AEV83998.1 hypothetical protein ACPL_3103 [Actinoplanes sp. SE50/110]ATO82391.1 hypothetical protein ACWT_2976 [Actinoplanes sp. SE50]SLL99798.1 hypothetical protein ACSP50_3030 [Actinoplanes sp. SE50/110]